MYELLHWFSPQAHLSQNSEWTLGENKHRVSTCCLPAFKHSQGRLCDYLISSLFSTSSKVLPSFLVFPQTPQSIRFFEEYCHWPTWVAWRTSSLGLFLQGSFDISHSCIRREGEKPSPFHCSPDLSVLYVSSYILPVTSLQNKDPWLFHVWCSLSTAWTSQCMIIPVISEYFSVLVCSLQDETSCSIQVYKRWIFYVPQGLQQQHNDPLWFVLYLLLNNSLPITFFFFFLFLLSQYFHGTVYSNPKVWFLKKFGPA